jgi:hypothetical protein
VYAVYAKKNVATEIAEQKEKTKEKIKGTEKTKTEERAETVGTTGAESKETVGTAGVESKETVGTAGAETEDAVVTTGIETKETAGTGNVVCRLCVVFCLLVLLGQLFAVRVFLVRYTSTQRKTIFETYHEVNHGVLRGIRLGDVDYDQYEKKTALLSKYVGETDRFLYVGCDMFLYSQLAAGQIATGNTISTPSFSEQLIQYYEKYPERIPTVIFVDREYVADFSGVLWEEPMKSFIQQYFVQSDGIMEPAVTVYLRK